MNDDLRSLKRETNQLRIQFDNKQQIVSNVELVIARAAPLIRTYVRIAQPGKFRMIGPVYEPI
jgi:hypothetical protein